MAHSESKFQRLAKIESLLFNHPEGLTQAQIAKHLGVNRSTIHRNLADLVAPVYEENGRILIDRESYLVNIRLTLHEAMCIHLAGRLMTTSLDRQNAHAASAFKKLGMSLERLAPRISRFVAFSANNFADESKVQDPHYIQVLEKLTLAWAKNQCVEVWYKKALEGEIKKYTYCPFFIEVGAIGQSIYSIGKILPTNEMRTFKLERIARIDLLNEFYEVPDDFDPEKLLAKAWGIWFTDQEPVEVVLKFSQRVAPRVRETRWHPSEEVIICEDGSLLWKGWIAEPKEMLPWIRGWGGDCEIVAPDNLREGLVEEVRRMMGVYDVNTEVEEKGG